LDPSPTYQPVHISASIMCADQGALDREVKRLEQAGVDSIHIDVMDGHFVPNLTFGPAAVAAIRRATDLPLHLHMMVANPEDLVPPFAEAGGDLYFFHLEADRYPLRLAATVSRRGMVPGVAVNPFTPIAPLMDLSLSHVLVMAVEPGFAGQSWVPNTDRRIKELRAGVGEKVSIGVDGNVTLDHAATARLNGASIFVCGTSSLFTADGYEVAVRRMRERLVAAENDAFPAPVAR
jgi:ribulose-phosphate 3-epimerase